MIFNHDIALELMWLVWHPVLHVLDAETGSLGEMVLYLKSTDDVWLVLRECWVTLHVLYPRNIRDEKEAAITSHKSHRSAVANGIVQ